MRFNDIVKYFRRRYQISAAMARESAKQLLEEDSGAFYDDFTEEDLESKLDFLEGIGNEV